MIPTHVTVQVTEKHIKHGSQRSCGNCPVALALQDLDWFQILDTSTDPEFDFSISVGTQNVAINLRRWLKILRTAKLVLPPEASQWIRRFDGGVRMQPITFDGILIAP